MYIYIHTCVHFYTAGDTKTTEAHHVCVSSLAAGGCLSFFSFFHNHTAGDTKTSETQPLCLSFSAARRVLEFLGGWEGVGEEVFETTYWSRRR